MEAKLRKRDGYGGWRDLPLPYLKEKLKNEINELLVALEYESAEEVMNESVDCANFCMFIWDVMRSRPDNRHGLIQRASKEKVHGQSR
jgi:phosphoribosyl-ATP pyrophosphohydrolase